MPIFSTSANYYDILTILIVAKKNNSMPKFEFIKIVNVDRPNKDNPSYGGPDGDNPFEKVTMTVKIMKQSQAIAN